MSYAERVKMRLGGVLSRTDGEPTTYERRVMDGDMRAARPLMRQAVGVNTLDFQLRPHTVRWQPAGTPGNSRAIFQGTFTELDYPFMMSDMFGEYTEEMRQGSLTRTIMSGCDTQFVLNHVWDGAPMARTTAGSLDLYPDGTCQARIDPARSDVAIVSSAIEGGELNAMSFAFWVTRQEWDDDCTKRQILEVDMDGGDVSVVTHPANPGTAGSVGLRSRQARALLRSRVPLLLAARAGEEQRAGATLSTATMNVLQNVLDLVASADESVDHAMPLLANLMGVPNPDDDQDASMNSASDSSAERAALRARLSREIH